MKEGYYKENNVVQQATAYLRRIRHRREISEWRVRKKGIALLVIDMQRYFLDESSDSFIVSSRPIIPGVKQLQDLFLSRKLPVIQTRHINNKKNAGLMDVWWDEVITEDNPLSVIVDDLKDQKIPVIKKGQYDAFFGTSLEKMLKKAGVKQVVITGVMTHLCCETTARSAFVRGFEVLFTVDGTATHREDYHKATLLNLSHGFAVPVLISEIIEALERK